MLNYDVIIKERCRKLLAIREDARYLSACKIIYKNDPVKFISDWMVTYDPQRAPYYLPFVLFPKQEELIKFFVERKENREDGLCEKCREVGFTWLAVAFAVHQWLFLPNQKFSFGSRKQDLVDEIGNPDSIFEKIRITLQYLPIEFLPHGFDQTKHAPFLKIINPENKSIITGEAGDNIGRGGRSTLYFIDEAAFLERPRKVEAALSANTDCKIYISTPNGIGNVFHQKRFSGKVPVFTFNWFDDPRKDEAWFKKKENALDSVIFAQEVLIDYGASVENVCIPAKWVKAAINFNIKGIDEGKIFAGLDVADEGWDANAFILRRGSKIDFIQSWKEGDTSQTALRAYRLGTDHDIDYLLYDNIGVGAGVKAELNKVKKTTGWNFDIMGVNVGAGDLPGNYVEGKKNKDMFSNLKAWLWWGMRRRFEKTHAVATGQKQYPVDELISIPNDVELITELSQPRFFFIENGKIQIESKKDMKKRGLSSPNKADAAMLAFTPMEFISKSPQIRML